VERDHLFEAKALELNLSSLQEADLPLENAAHRLLHGGKSAGWFLRGPVPSGPVMVEESVAKGGVCREDIVRDSGREAERARKRHGGDRECRPAVRSPVQELPMLGIKSCCLSLFEPSFKDSRLVFAYDDEGRIPWKEGGVLLLHKRVDARLNTASLRPQELRRPRARPLGKEARIRSFRARRRCVIAWVLDIRQDENQRDAAIHLDVPGDCHPGQAPRGRQQRSRAEATMPLQEFAYGRVHDLQGTAPENRNLQRAAERTASRYLGQAVYGLPQEDANAASRMQKLIESLLSYSRVTTMPSRSDRGSRPNRGTVLLDLEVRRGGREMAARVEVQPLP